MKLRKVLLCLLACCVCAVALAQTSATAAKSANTVCESCLRADVEFLASDALRGRGSATEDELIAANYVASVFHRYELESLPGGNYIIPVTLDRMKFTRAPELKFTTGAKETIWTHGKEMVVRRMSAPEASGKLFHAEPKAELAANAPAGSVVLLNLPLDTTMQVGQKLLLAFFQTKAAAVIVPAISEFNKYWDQMAMQPAELPASLPGDKAKEQRPALLVVRPADLAALQAAPEGTEVSIGGPVASDPVHTRNVVGTLRGSDPKLKDEYIVLSAHMDHLGVCRKQGDTICNGANDDASGTATILELARIFTQGPRPKRSILFVAFGSEELGLFGSRAFAAQPPVPLKDIVAAIEFEQTGLPESKAPGSFWMTGSGFSDLEKLLNEHGSKLAEDPFPGSPFFRQSDNYSLAEKGVVAHTISGAAEFPNYHQPGDEAQKLDYDFMANSLQKTLPGLEWLANTDVKPAYLPGKNPAAKQ